MPVNPPSKVRIALYILTALGTPLVAYFNAKHIIGSLEVILWSTEVTVVSAIAGFNVKS